jgi:hypothetical protein
VVISISVNHNKVPIPALEKWNHVTGDQVHVGLHLIVGYLKVRTAASALAKGGAAPVAPMSGKTKEGVTAAKKDSVGEPEQVSPAPVASVSSPPPQFNGGRFKADFNDGGKSVAGQAGIFKSTSGWQDGKYYALINNVPVGTIVKITDQATSKSIYAKVLGQLPDMKESAGLTIRVSNAAAAELGEGEARFDAKVGY